MISELSEQETSLAMAETQLDIVIPVFNEIEIIELLHTRVVAACENTGLRYRVIYVDDGSHDGTNDWIRQNADRQFHSSDDRPPLTLLKNQRSLAAQGSRHQYEDNVDGTDGRLRGTATRIGGTGQSVGADGSNVGGNESGIHGSMPGGGEMGTVTLIELSRNFGQPAAILAGLEQSSGGCVVIMDGDLQDPPELIPELVERWIAGDQVVIAERTSRQESFWRGLAFKAFHSTFRFLADSKIPPNTGTFCLLDRVAADSICSLPESHRFFPGLRAWVGHRQSMVQFQRPPRAGGEPKQTFVRLLKYALDAVFGYSFKPLRLLTSAGVVVCSISFMLAFWFMFKRLFGWETASIGFTTLTCAVFGLGGFQLIGMGVLGEYIGRIYDEVKARPQYLIARQSNFRLEPAELSQTHARSQPLHSASRIAG